MPYKGVSPPQEPANYDPQNKFKDPVTYLKHREAAVASEYVNVADAKLLRDKLITCYKTAGTNFLTECKELSERYIESIKGAGISRANEGRYENAHWAK